MTIHANDIANTIRKALKDPAYNAQAPSQSGILVTPNNENLYPNRDGKLTFDCVSRDYNRAFRITIEAIKVDDAPEAASGYEDEPPTA